MKIVNIVFESSGNGSDYHVNWTDATVSVYRWCLLSLWKFYIIQFFFSTSLINLNEFVWQGIYFCSKSIRISLSLFLSLVELFKSFSINLNMSNFSFKHDLERDCGAFGASINSFSSVRFIGCFKWQFMMFFWKHFMEMNPSFVAWTKTCWITIKWVTSEEPSQFELCMNIFNPSI